MEGAGKDRHRLYAGAQPDLGAGNLGDCACTACASGGDDRIIDCVSCARIGACAAWRYWHSYETSLGCRFRLWTSARLGLRQRAGRGVTPRAQYSVSAALF